MLCCPKIGIIPCGAIPYQPGKIDAIREAVKELEKPGISSEAGARRKGRLRVRTISSMSSRSYPKNSHLIGLPSLENPTLDNPTLEKPTLENPTQLNKEILSKEQSITDVSITHSIPIPSLNPFPLTGRSGRAAGKEGNGSENNSAVEIYRGDYQGQYRVRFSLGEKPR